MSFQTVVTTLLESCSGARGAAVIDPDGIPVVTVPHDATLEVLGAEYARVLRDVDEAGREFRHGTLEQFSIYSETTIVILTVITAGYFLVVVLDRDAVVGKARLLSRLTRERLFPEFT